MLGSKQSIPGDMFLCGELLVDEFTRDSESSARRMRYGLGEAQSNVTRCSWSGHYKNFSNAVEHYKRNTDIPNHKLPGPLENLVKIRYATPPKTLASRGWVFRVRNV